MTNLARKFHKENKDLVGLKVMTSEEVWTIDKQGKRKLRKDIDIYGRVDKGTSAFVTSTNLSGGNHRVVENTCELPKGIKNDIVSLLKNKNKKVAYLVRTDKK